MKYGVIVCPNCNKVKAVDLTYNSTKCFKCNKVIKLKNIRIFFKSNSQIEIRQAIGKINFELINKK